MPLEEGYDGKYVVPERFERCFVYHLWGLAETQRALEEVSVSVSSTNSAAHLPLMARDLIDAHTAHGFFTREQRRDLEREALRGLRRCLDKPTLWQRISSVLN